MSQATQLALRGAKEIGRAAGVSWREVPRMVKENGLPAFKIDGKGGWLALAEDLECWLREQRDKALGRG